MSLRRKTQPVKSGKPTKIAKAAKLAKILPLETPGVVRLSLVAEARRRIASGWYDRAEVRDSLVEAVLVEFRSY